MNSKTINEIMVRSAAEWDAAEGSELYYSEPGMPFHELEDDEMYQSGETCMNFQELDDLFMTCALGVFPHYSEVKNKHNDHGVCFDSHFRKNRTASLQSAEEDAVAEKMVEHIDHLVTNELVPMSKLFPTQDSSKKPVEDRIKCIKKVGKIDYGGAIDSVVDYVDDTAHDLSVALNSFASNVISLEHESGMYARYDYCVGNVAEALDVYEKTSCYVEPIIADKCLWKVTSTPQRVSLYNNWLRAKNWFDSERHLRRRDKIFVSADFEAISLALVRSDWLKIVVPSVNLSMLLRDKFNIFSMARKPRCQGRYIDLWGRADRVAVRSSLLATPRLYKTYGFQYDHSSHVPYITNIVVDYDRKFKFESNLCSFHAPMEWVGFCTNPLPAPIAHGLPGRYVTTSGLPTIVYAQCSRAGLKFHLIDYMTGERVSSDMIEAVFADESHHYFIADRNNGYLDLISCFWSTCPAVLRKVFVALASTKSFAIEARYHRLTSSWETGMGSGGWTYNVTRHKYTKLAILSVPPHFSAKYNLNIAIPLVIHKVVAVFDKNVRIHKASRVLDL